MFRDEGTIKTILWLTKIKYVSEKLGYGAERGTTQDWIGICVEETAGV
jgi:hypothetical protein